MISRFPSWEGKGIVIVRSIVEDLHLTYYLWTVRLMVILKPLRRFAIQKPNASLLLFAATIVAMVLANSPWADRYHQLLAFPIDLQAGQFTSLAHHGETMSMLAFVNDALWRFSFS